jgi:hypothetical protein
MNENLNDYAMPLISIERMTKQVHDLCLEHKYAQAGEVALHLGTEVRILQAVLAIMETGPSARPRSS